MAGMHVKPRATTSLLGSFTTKACCTLPSTPSPYMYRRIVLTKSTGLRTTLQTITAATVPSIRPFSSTSSTKNWLQPTSGESTKSRKGRPRVRTGGSVKGTTLVWGDYGIRLKDHHRRISAGQLKVADETIRKRLRGMKYRLYHRISADIGVYTSGNDQRMGKGKGSFDHWATRMGVSKIAFELKGDIHEQVVRDAFRLAGNKLPGLWEFVRKGDPPVMGITKLGDGVTEEFLRRPRRETNAVGVQTPSLEGTARRLPATSAP